MPWQFASIFSFDVCADAFKCTDDEVLAPALRILRMYGAQEAYLPLLRKTLTDSPKDLLQILDNPKALDELTQIQAFQLLADICRGETNLTETFGVFFDPKLCSPCKQINYSAGNYISRDRIRPIHLYTPMYLYNQHMRACNRSNISVNTPRKVMCYCHMLNTFYYYIGDGWEGAFACRKATSISTPTPLGRFKRFYFFF